MFSEFANDPENDELRTLNYDQFWVYFYPLSANQESELGNCGLDLFKTNIIIATTPIRQLTLHILIMSSKYTTNF